LHDKPEQLAQPRLQGRCIELLPCSCRGDDQDAEHVQGAGFVRLAVEHGPYQEGEVAAKTRVGVQASGQLLQALGGADGKTFFLQEDLQVLNIRLKAMGYLNELRGQKHPGQNLPLRRVPRVPTALRTVSV
jgi:hypothetical protein